MNANYVTVKDILDTVETLKNDYQNLMHKAMDNDEDLKVYQFSGSCIALDVLVRALGIEEPVAPLDEC